jgi:hypothetical protein
MPLWDDLGSAVATSMNSPYDGDAIKALSRYCIKNTKFDLVTFLGRVLHEGVAKPGEAHRHFARLPFRQVLTTNFDFLLENAYYEEGKPCRPVVDADLLSFPVPDGGARLVKMHGDLHHPSLMVITEQDFDRYRDDRSDMFQEVTSLIKRHTMLFIGYSVEDPDFRQIWALVKKHLGELRRPAYAFAVGATDAQVDEFKGRGVTRVIDLPGRAAEYGDALVEAFRCIGRDLTA